MKMKYTLSTIACSLFVFFPVMSFAQGIVNVYSYRQPELIQPLFAAFTEKTGIKVKTVFLKKGMVERLQAEGRRSPVDIVFTVDIGRLSALKDAGVLQPVNSTALKKAIPARYRDPGSEWFGLTTRARIIYASKERVKDGEITTYEDLADEKWRGRICIRSGTNAYNLALFAAYMKKNGKKNMMQWLKDLKANLARKPQGNDRAQVKAIAAGECDISIGNSYYMALMLKNPKQKGWADAVDVVFPTFKNGGTHVNISGVGMAKFAPNRANALKLMEFLASDEGQRLYAEINYEYPISKNVPADNVVELFGSFTPDKTRLGAIARLRPKALEIVEKVGFDD